MKTAGKTMKKQGTQPRTKKKMQKKTNLIPRPNDNDNIRT